MMNQRIHGAANETGLALFDFSTNANACGACPPALQAVQNADAAHYPDFTYTALRKALADFHGVAVERMVLAGSASEFIFRITSFIAFTARTTQQRKKSVWIPRHAYGDYAHAAHAWGLERVTDIRTADLVWACEPSSPLGQAHAEWSYSPAATVVLDCAYAPLRLSGQPSLNAEGLQSVWQLYSPNKALGLTGIRAAYAIAPRGAESTVVELNALAPSWVVGSHGVAMLMAWTQSSSQNWLAQTLPILREWKERQITLLKNHGWMCEPSDANFFCAKPPAEVTVETLCHDWRSHGIQLRNAASFDLAGWVRLGVREPLAQAALCVKMTH